MITLRESLKEYLEMRRGLGYKLARAGSELTQFIQFMEDKCATHIDNDLSLEWAQLPTKVQPSMWAARLGFVRGFAKYRSAIDNLTEVPSIGLLPYRKRRARPYIYNDREIARLLQAALALPPTDGLRRWTYYVLFGLLAVTGLRIGEALNIKLDDVDLDEGILTVRGTKFGKTRLIPLHQSTQKVLARYIKRRCLFLGDRPSLYLFISSTANRLAQSSVSETFYALSRQIGLRHPCANHGPRIHDFRHRFAVRTILTWYRSGKTIEARLPALSTYLGHVSIGCTYWYLSASPELMAMALKRLKHRGRAVS